MPADNRNRDREQVITQFLSDVPLEGSFALQNLLADMKSRLEELWQNPNRPAQPGNVTVTANNLGNNISWNLTPNATGYQAFRNVSGDITTATLLRELPGNGNVSFFDPNDQTTALRYYWIRGVNAKGDPGAFSLMVSGSNFLTDITGTAMGVDAIASGSASTALGRNATASAANATAMGVSSLADAADATALGKSADAGGTDAVACGQAANASATNATAVGANTAASASGATTVGEGGSVSGANSVGVGQALSITAASSVVVGQAGSVTGATSVIVGQGSSTTAVNTVGVGQGISITQPGAIAIGQGASVTGAGFSNSIAIGKAATIANFSNAIVIGTTTTPASDTVAIGYGITNGYGVTIGRSATNNNSTSVAIGPNASVAAANAVAIGSGTTMSATGGNGVVIGTGSTCADTECVVVGYNSTVSSGNDSCILIGASLSNSNSNELILIGKSLTATASNQAQIGSAILNYWLGRGVTHTGAAQSTLIHATDGTGTNVAGDLLILAGGAPTGSGTGGSVKIQTAPAGASGTDLRALVDRLTITETGASEFSSTLRALRLGIGAAADGSAQLSLGGFLVNGSGAGGTATFTGNITSTAKITAATAAAVSGIAVSGVSTASQAIAAIRITATDTGVSHVYIESNNGVEAGLFGVERSAGGGLAVNTSAYATVVGAISNRDLQLVTNNTLRVTIASTGIVTMNAYTAGAATFDANGVISSVSDSRFKLVQGPFTAGLKELREIQPVLFKYNQRAHNAFGLDTQNMYVSALAQEVALYIPEAVGLGSGGIYSLNPFTLFYAAINAIRELEARIVANERINNIPVDESRAVPVSDDSRIIKAKAYRQP